MANWQKSLGVQGLRRTTRLGPAQRGACLAVAGLALWLVGCAGVTEGRPMGQVASDALIAEDFDRLPDGSGVPEGWWVEGGERVWIEQGRLRVRANPKDDAIAADRHNLVCTVWCPQPVQGDVRIAFDACVLASETDVRNINVFFLYSDPSGRPLHGTRHERQDAAYESYHGLNGYILTFLADVPKSRQYHADGTPKARLRLRRCPGFQLVDETHDYHCQIGRVYHVELVRVGGRVTGAVDGTVYLRWEDPTPPAGGLVGFRTFRTDLWFDNLRVSACSGERGAE